MDWQVTIEPAGEKSANPAFDITAPKTFPAGVDQITFGREKTCDITFPPDARIVSSMHGRLYRQPSGDYALEAYGDHYFEVNGYEASPGQHIGDGAIIRFGNPKGPAVRVRLTRGARTDGLLSTLTQAGGEPLAKILQRYGKAITGLAAALVVAVGVGAYLYITAPDFDHEIAALRQTMEEKARGGFSPADIDALYAAAFAVVKRDATGAEKVLGTAWPYQPGMLVTNAHVAAAVEARGKGETVLVRRPGGTADFEVIAPRIHPGYRAFSDFIDNTVRGSAGFRSMTDGLGMPSAYDVAILEVNPAADIGPMLPVEPNPVPQLKPGAALAFAGYEIEGTGAQRSSQLKPTPQLQYGNITSLTDYFLFGTDDGHAYLVQNSLPANGGASGSPIIDQNGKVVAILSGGNVNTTPTGRTPSAALLNFAQRVDLLPGVLDQAAFDAAAEHAYWDEVAQRFDTHERSVVADARRTIEAETGSSVGDPDKVKASLKTGEAVKAGPSQYRDHEFPVEAGRSYRALVYGDPGGTLSLVLFRGDQAVKGNFGTNSFASLDYTATATETLKLRVVGKADKPVAYTLYTFNAPAKLVSATPAAN